MKNVCYYESSDRVISFFFFYSCHCYSFKCLRHSQTNTKTNSKCSLLASVFCVFKYLFAACKLNTSTKEPTEKTQITKTPLLVFFGSTFVQCFYSLSQVERRAVQVFAFFSPFLSHYFINILSVWQFSGHIENVKL